MKILDAWRCSESVNSNSVHHDGEFFRVEEKIVYFLYGITEVEIPKYPETGNCLINWDLVRGR